MKYPTELSTITIDDFDIRFHEITDADVLFDALIALGNDHEDVRDERIPYWAEMWPSAVALAKHVARSKYIDADSKVLEIGCGLGLPGIVAGKRGGKVTLTDYLQDALDFAEENWKLNNIAEASFVLLDWRHPDPSFKADVLLASDVAYETKAFDYLIHSFETLVNQGGIILLSEPGRHYAREFFPALDKKGFLRSTFHYPITLRGIKHNIGVHQLIKPV